MYLARIWKRRLKAGTQKWDDCPEDYKTNVKTLFAEDIKNGLMTAEEYKTITGEDYAA